MDVHSILEDLPSNLRNEVAMALTGDVVRKVPVSITHATQRAVLVVESLT